MTFNKKMILWVRTCIVITLHLKISLEQCIEISTANGKQRVESVELQNGFANFNESARELQMCKQNNIPSTNFRQLFIVVYYNFQNHLLCNAIKLCEWQFRRFCLSSQPFFFLSSHHILDLCALNSWKKE